ncbi:hypothetical protein DB30_03581 [Enhygromyxa salina]|uniref:Uncharacterized protein n=1 Tax=Enhygromyxa salina TaxID=215803 RepID=A0A0C1ZH77_9BACT|nr:DUF2004 domain-containing protein [Enhygromyxa salina]KIG16984.1 hypothetical protein DB30_03581 [Enhygromyxa salina]
MSRCCLTALDTRAREAMAADLARGEEGDAVDSYESHHIEALGEALNQHSGVSALAKLVNAVFISATLVCDYTVGAELTQYSIAVSFSGEVEVVAISMES